MRIKLSQHCQETLYRTVWIFPEDHVAVYLHAESRDAASRKMTMYSRHLLDDGCGHIDFTSMCSYQELVDIGVSEDHELRIFELSRRNRRVVRWVESPLFLSIDQSLIGKWVSLNTARVVSSVMALGGIGMLDDR